MKSLFFFILGLFLFLRLYSLATTINFHGDMGRDFLVLQDWYTTWKPPLLGPQTSVISFNQSAVYFYLLFPLYVLSGQSELSSVLTLVAFYVFFAGLGFWLFKKDRMYFWLLVVFSFFVTIHPQFVWQHRYVWNPSFLAPVLFAAWWAFQQLRTTYLFKYELLFATSLALAMSLNYSVFPTLVAFYAVAAVMFKWKTIRLLGLGVVAGVALNITTLFFEIRHDFILSRNIFSHGVLQQAELNQNRIIDFIGHLFPAFNSQWSLMLLGLFIVTLLAGGWYLFRTQQQSVVKPYGVTLALLSLTSFLIVGLPITIHTHYIFGILTLTFIALGLLPLRITAPLLLVCILIWLSPRYVASYFVAPQPTLAEIKNCIQTLCSNETQPLYVSVHSPSHNHSGSEYRYLMKKLGCTGAPSIDTQPNQAHLMAVYADDITYDHGKTAYNELTLFGPAQPIQIYHCRDDFKIHILKKLE